MSQSLRVNHQLNYDEVIRRLEFWTNEPDMNVRKRDAIALLIDMLRRDRDNLYFEGRAQ